jgi:ABC-2 type transport system permease protein
VNAFSRSLKRIVAIADKEWIQIRRDSRSLILSLLAPVLLILLFGYALTMDVKNVSMAVYDQDRTSSSREFLEGFSHTDYIFIHSYVNGYDEIDRLIDRGDIAMAMVIPKNFAAGLRAGKRAKVQLLIDGSDSMSATVSLGYVQAIVMRYNRNIQVGMLESIGITNMKEPVDVRNRTWYNPEMKSRNLIIPGLIVIILAIISALITSLAISREWERGTMETLITTPVRPREVLLGKLIPYLFIGVFDVVLTFLVGKFVFGVPMQGSFFELLLIAFLFLVGTSSLGILISAATRIQVMSIQVAIVVTYLPSLILSGFIFPVKNMPVFVQGITYLIPATYMVTVIKGIAIKGVAWSLLVTQIMFLTAFTLLVMTVAMKKIRMQLPE